MICRASCVPWCECCGGVSGCVDSGCVVCVLLLCVVNSSAGAALAFHFCFSLSGSVGGRRNFSPSCQTDSELFSVLLCSCVLVLVLVLVFLCLFVVLICNV